MNDDDETESTTAELPTIAPDTFAAVLALAALAVDPKATGARLRSLQEHQAAAAKATAELTTARAAFEQETATAWAQIAASSALLEKRRVDLHQHELAIAEARKEMATLINAWKFVGESNPLVLSGLMDAQYKPLEKAQRALGRVPVQVNDPADTPDLESDDRELTRSVDGVPFPPNTTITREVGIHVQSRHRTPRPRAQP